MMNVRNMKINILQQIQSVILETLGRSFGGDAVFLENNLLSSE